ncbi:MAG: DNA-directed RNA polymerase subunit omega [Lachnospiraceae bacterium]|nr:DNA-directed RNA polymerase subunit omega [Lachnospiraceae bacterium]
MLHPSYSELMDKINKDAGEPVVKSRYSIVMSTAKRARQMVDKDYYTLPDHARKPLSIAVEELYEGDIRILSEEENKKFQEEYERRWVEEKAKRAEEEARKLEEMEAMRLADLKAMQEEDDEEDEEGLDEADFADYDDPAESPEEGEIEDDSAEEG